MAWTGRATVFPAPMSLGATFNGSLIQEIGEAVAKEVHYILAVLAYFSLNMALGYIPCMCVE